jgi:hypothetical protein
MPTIEQTLSDRMSRYDNVPGLAPVRRAFNQALDVHQTFRTKAAEVAKDTHKTAIGKQDALRKYIGAEAHRVVRARKTLEKAQSKLAEKRKALQPKAPDKTDVAAAVARSDLRGMLRGMPIGKRMGLLLADNADPMLLAAALELPNYASDINDETRRLVTERVIEREQPGALAKIEIESEALAMLAVANRVLENTARDVAEFPNNQILNDFLEKAVGDTSQLEADVDRQLEAAA